MSIRTGVPTSFVVPGTFHVFNYLRSSGSLVTVPLVIALIATKAASGTAVLGTVYDVEDAAVTDSLGGQSSEGALMCRKAFECAALFGGGPRVKITYVAEPAGGVAQVQTITSAGTATADGNQIIAIAGRRFSIGVTIGRTAAQNAGDIAAALQAVQETLPTLITSATTVVTATHPTKGINGADVKIEVLQQVAGLTLTAAIPTAGTGAAVIQPALDALAPLRYSGIVIANHASADITSINADILTRWSPGSKTWGHYYIGESGTIGTATSLAAAANHPSVIVANWEGCPNAPGEMATATAMLVYSREAANASYDGAVLPLYPPAEGLLYTSNEKNTAIKAGLTVFEAVIDSTGAITQGRAKCVQLVTSRSTTSQGYPDDKNRDIAVSRVGIEIAIQLDIAGEAMLGSESNPQGVAQEDALVLIRDLASSVLRAEARAGVISRSYVEDDVAALKIEPDETVLGRNNVQVQYHPRIPLHQIAYAHNILVGV